jgi:hypothetical protein
MQEQDAKQNLGNKKENEDCDPNKNECMEGLKCCKKQVPMTLIVVINPLNVSCNLPHVIKMKTVI